MPPKVKFDVGSGVLQGEGVKMNEVSRKGFSWMDGDIVVEVVCGEERPRSLNVRQKGDSKYPWGEVPVGGAVKVRRALDTVKQACRRWCKVHHGFKFVIWRKADGWVVAKRVR